MGPRLREPSRRKGEITQPRAYIFTICVKIKDSDLSAHVWRSLYDVARQYRESIDVYGTKKSFEWTLVENEPREAIQ